MNVAVPSGTPPPNGFPENLRLSLQQPQLPGLDALRAFAAWLVVFYHQGLAVPGDLGVLAFFVLSGFLITWLLLKEHQKYGDISLKLFYLRRALRIFPAFYLYWLAVVGLLLLFGKNLQRPQAWASFFYMTNYYQALHGHVSSGFSHTWSLAVEEQFYLLWPLGLLVLLRRKADLTRWLMGSIAAFWIWRAVLEFAIQVQEVWVYEAFDARADHLLMGCLLAVVLREQRAPGLFRRLCAHPALPVVTLGVLVAEVAIGQRMGGYGARSFEFILQPLLVAALIVQWMAFAVHPGWRWLNWGWLVYLGKISYSTYLYQQIVPAAMKPVFNQWPMAPPIVLTLPVIVAAASASYFLVEKPFLKLKDRFGSRQTTAGGTRDSGEAAVPLRRVA